jgi:hypothetical protein
MGPDAFVKYILLEVILPSGEQLILGKVVD